MLNLFEALKRGTARRRRSLRPLEGLALALALYQTLPSQLLPRATVEFVAALGEPKTKELELSNPFKKQVRTGLLPAGAACWRLLVHLPGSLVLPSCKPWTARHAMACLQAMHDGQPAVR